MTDREIRVLAGEIVAELFTTNTGKQAEKLPMILPGDVSDGWWERGSAQDRIEAVIRKHLAGQ